MRIPKSRVSSLAQEIFKSLVEHKDIETETPSEVQRDIESVLNQYIRDEQEITDKARDIMARQGLPSSQIGKTKRQLAEQRNFKLGEDGIDYIVDQLIEFLMHSHNVDEIYAPDHRLRRLLREPLRRVLHSEGELDTAVRGRMKHMQEGTAAWEIEYQRILEDVKRRKGI